MNFKKAATIATAVGALAAISVPAMAFESEFHGIYRLRGITTNYMSAGIADVAAVPASYALNTKTGVIELVPAKAGTTALREDAPTNTFFEQRIRLQYTAKASADLKLVTQFEADSSWGDAAYTNGRGIGGAMGADTVNLETKHAYLDWNCPLTGANVKVGIQPQTDAYKGVLFTDDMAGVFVAKKIAGVTAKAGFARLYDSASIGKKTEDIYLLEGKFAVSKDITVGGTYYLVRNDTLNLGNADMHMVGVNAEAKFGMVSGDAFIAYQGGTELYGTTGKDLSAFAAQVGAKINLDKAGTVRADILYLSGDDGSDTTETNAWQTLKSNSNQLAASNAYYSSKMMLLVRNIFNMDSDKALVYNLSNLTLLTAGYDAKITDKLDLTANIGYAMLNEKGALSSSSIGTELNAAANYKLFANLTATLEAAYVVLGDSYEGVGTGVAPGDKPTNPYMAEVMLNYVF